MSGLARLQVALDLLDLDEALNTAKNAAKGGADLIEAGTPLIKSQGLSVVRDLASEIGDQAKVVADMKVMDAGYLETRMAAETGASIVTVLGASTQNTVTEAVRAGREHGVEIMADLIGVDNKARYARKLESLGVDYISVHTGIDELGSSPNQMLDLEDVVKAVRIPVAAAGGLDRNTAASAVDKGASIVVVGRAITANIDVEMETRSIKKIITQELEITNVKKAMRILSKHIQDSSYHISQDQVNSLLGRIDDASRIFVCGSGRSGLVARAFAMRLMHLGYQVHVVGETITPPVSSEDLIIAVSGSGETTLPLTIAGIAKAKNAGVVAVTSFLDSPLGGLADQVVTIPGRMRQTENEPVDHLEREARGDHAPLTPMGTLFEIGAMAFLDGVVAELTSRKGLAEHVLEEHHTNLE